MLPPEETTALPSSTTTTATTAAATSAATTSAATTSAAKTSAATTATTATAKPKDTEEMEIVDGQIVGQKQQQQVYGDFSESVATVLPFQVISADELTSTTTTTTTTTTITKTTTTTTTTTTTSTTTNTTTGVPATGSTTYTDTETTVSDNVDLTTTTAPDSNTEAATVQSWDDLEVYTGLDSPRHTTLQPQYDDTTLSTIKLFDESEVTTQAHEGMTTEVDTSAETSTENSSEATRTDEVFTEGVNEEPTTESDSDPTNILIADTPTAVDTLAEPGLGRLTTPAPPANKKEDSVAQPNIPRDQSTVAPQDAARKPAATTTVYYTPTTIINDAEILDDDVDYDAGHDYGEHILDATTTGAPHTTTLKEDVTLSSKPLFEAEAVVAEEYEDNDNIIGLVTDRVFDETTTGSPDIQQPSGFFIAEPVVAEEEEGIQVRTI